MAPKWRRTPWRTGSSASKRLPEGAAWLPTHSPEQWSTATNTRARPSLRVTVSVMSVPVRDSVPNRIYGGGGDGAIVRALLRTADPVWREQAVLAHEAADPPGRGADPGMAQPGPDLAVAFAVQARAEDMGADMLEQRGVGAGPHRTAAGRAGRRRGTGRRATAVDRGTGEVPNAGDPSQTIAPTRDRRDGPAHRPDQ